MVNVFNTFTKVIIHYPNKLSMAFVAVREPISLPKQLKTGRHRFVATDSPIHRLDGADEPRGVFHGPDFASGKRQGVNNGFLLGGLKYETIRFKEKCGRHQPGSLVSIKKRMIAHNPCCIASREFDQSRLFVVKKLLGSCECGVQQALIPDAGMAAKSGDEFVMKCEAFLLGDPAGFAHFASSRNELR